MQEYFNACTTLSLQLLEAFCIGLNLPPKFLHTNFSANHTSFLRLNHYPVYDPIEGAGNKHQPEANLGVHHHTDSGALTVLIQDQVGGLQVHRKGFWYDIPPVPGAIVVNTGDMMQVWSNDVYHAPVHRVLAMEDHVRFSLPFFFNPAADALVRPLPTVTSEHNPSRYRDIAWATFRGKRTDGDYADYGTEVQISQFRR
jgi:isopenicillin N synthase-like dioxygenase